MNKKKLVELADEYILARDNYLKSKKEFVRLARLIDLEQVKRLYGIRIIVNKGIPGVHNCEVDCVGKP